MTYSVYLLSYNNYYNRRVRYQASLNDYLNDGAILIATIDDAGWKFGDSITTAIIANYNAEDFGQPDYVLVEDQYGNQTRWFVMDEAYKREGQYQLTLRRDVIADSYSVLLDSPIYIERATAKINSALLFTPENNSYNQLKTSQTSLKDKSGCPWVVGYIDSKYSDTSPITIPADTNYNILQTFSSTSDFPYYNNRSEANLVPLGYQSITFCMPANNGNYGVSNNYWIGIDQNGNLATPTLQQDKVYTEGLTNNTSVTSTQRIGSVTKNGVKLQNETAEIARTAREGNYGATLLDMSYNYTGIPRSSATAPDIERYSEAYIIIAGTVYQVHVRYGTAPAQRATGDSASNAIFYNFANATGLFKTVTGAGQFEYVATGAYVDLEKIDTASLSTTIPSTRHKLEDAPYDMFCMPYGSILFGREANTNQNISSIDASSSLSVTQRIATNIATQLDANCYDIQILPYCPLPDSMIGNFNYFDLTHMAEGVDYNFITADNDPVGVMFWLRKSNFTKTLNYSITVPTDALNLKVANETDIYRLVSPNYASIYEFSVAKNYGVAQFFVSCSYKPINPYIKVCPKFKGYNGNNFIDPRGLILSGDFSMPRIQDAWINYELQNKNYHAMFDRQVESMNLQSGYQHASDVASATLGALSAGAQGYMMGNMAGMGGAGTVAMAGIMSGLSMGAGVADVAMKSALRKEQISLYEDLFKYQNGNIKALPNTLTNVSALNPDNLLFPQLEYYTATPEEKNALKEQFKYRGMSINAISTLSDYIAETPSYIKGKFIQLPQAIQENYHYANEINNEINMGVYI